ncbi:ATP-binding protein [Octadecabacter sp.]|nr:ATP-binding protein [Octadecabacter sp.]
MLKNMLSEKRVDDMQVRLQTFLVILLLLVSSLPVLVFLLWPFTLVYDARVSEVRERHLLLANNVSGALELYHEDIKTAMEAFSRSIVSSDAENARALFVHLGFYHVCVIDKTTGVVETSYLGADHPCPNALDQAQLAAIALLGNDGTPGFSGVVTPGGGAPRIQVVSDLGDVLVVGAVGTEFFRQQQRAISFGENGHAVIVDQFGRILAHPNPQWEQDTRDISRLEIVQAMVRDETGVTQFFSPAFNEDMIAGYTSVPGVGWGVMVPQPLREFRVAAQVFNREVLLILLIGLAASLLTAFFLARLFEKRLDSIQHTISDIADGTDGINLGTAHRMFNIATFHKLEQSIVKMFAELKQSRVAQRDYSLKLEQSNAQLQNEIDTRKSAQSGLTSVEKRYNNLFENVPIAIREEDLSQFKAKIDGLGFTDATLFENYLNENPAFVEDCGKSIQVVDVNAASLKLHNLTDKSELKTRVLESFGPESMRFLRSVAMKMFKRETSDHRQTVIYRDDGQPRHLISTWSVLPGYEGTYGWCLLTSVDITEQVEVEDRLRQSQKMEAIGQLTGGIAHDFNNLLAVMQGNADLLAQDPNHDREFIEPITAAVQRGAELTQRLLAFSRKQSLAPKSVDLLALTNGMGNLLRRTLGPKIEISIRGEEGLCNVHADPGQIEAALLNLALNARDAMPSGGKLSILCRPATIGEVTGRDLEPGNYAVMSVTDTGEGISEDEISHVFEPFFTTKPVGKGSGLGLSMVYGFCRQSKGDVMVKSGPGIGTTLSLFLPLSGANEEELVIKSTPVIAPKNTGSSILVLEDTSDVLLFLEKTLTRQGYKVLTATTIDDARKIVDAGHDIDVLVSDVLLPGNQNGPDFAIEFREIYVDRPIIFISGYPADLQGAQTDLLEKTLWLAKPFKASELLAAIEELTLGQ